jgi:hypothetical protein
VRLRAGSAPGSVEELTQPDRWIVGGAPLPCARVIIIALGRPYMMPG